jgi:hypothetical protein
MLPGREPNNVLQMYSLLISSGCFLCVSFDPNAHLPFLSFVLFLSAEISPLPGAECNISRLDLAPGLCFFSTDADALLELLVWNGTQIRTNTRPK